MCCFVSELYLFGFPFNPVELLLPQTVHESSYQVKPSRSLGSDLPVQERLHLPCLLNTQVPSMHRKLQRKKRKIFSWPPRLTSLFVFLLACLSFVLFRVIAPCCFFTRVYSNPTSFPLLDFSVLYLKSLTALTLSDLVSVSFIPQNFLYITGYPTPHCTAPTFLDKSYMPWSPVLGSFSLPPYYCKTFVFCMVSLLKLIFTVESQQLSHE